MLKRITLATVAALSAIGLAAPAAAAGGVGNFYNSTSCSTFNGTLKANLTNYDINAYTDQRYHHGGNSYSGFYPSFVEYDGKRWPISGSEIWDALGHSGTVADGYQDFANMLTDHTVRFGWRNSSGTYKWCTLPEI